MAATMAVLNTKILTTNVMKPSISYKQPQPIKPFNLFSIPNVPKGLTTTSTTAAESSITGTALAGAFFYTIASCNPAFAAQQIAEIAEASSSDSRGLALLLPIIPAIAWVLFNILQPALNQINQMRSVKGVTIGVGLGGLVATGLLLHPLQASAAEIGMIAEATSDNRGQLLLFVIAPAIAWVLYNILQPALNQINKMRSE